MWSASRIKVLELHLEEVRFEVGHGNIGKLLESGEALGGVYGQPHVLVPCLALTAIRFDEDWLARVNFGQGDQRCLSASVGG